MTRLAARVAVVLSSALALSLAALGALGSAQDTASPYVPDPDPFVRQKIDAWQDLKLGLLMHWGTYSQWGIVESWSLCSEDEPWCTRSMDDYGAYKTAYEKLQTTFNPVNFDPERWAKAAADAGMRYVVFTTKHHDGFSMFDTRETDYRITSPRTPFSTNLRADVTRGIFDAFRAQGFLVGAYFSKPDWHSPDYWWPYFATPDRNPNYDIKKHPDRWARFVQFTHAQIDELMSRYDRVDILWLDGGWVRPRTDAEIRAAINSPDYKFARVQSQDIDMPRLVAEARAKQPGLIVVDRDVPGPYQNYLTPEARVPPLPLPYPWEVPMPMARSWSYVPNDVYKSPRALIQMLVDVVAKGGNLLLNIGPGPDGTWHDAAYDRLAALGAWMKVNGGAIYGTRPIAPYAAGQVRLTRAKDGAVYATYLPGTGETALPRELTVPGISPAPGATITLLGTSRTIPWDRSGTGFVAHVPVGLAPPNADAWVFRVSRVGR
jgi:alpha-L-fucosidase